MVETAVQAKVVVGVWVAVGLFAVVSVEAFVGVWVAVLDGVFVVVGV